MAQNSKLEQKTKMISTRIKTRRGGYEYVQSIRIMGLQISSSFFVKIIFLRQQWNFLIVKFATMSINDSIDLNICRLKIANFRCFSVKI